MPHLDVNNDRRGHAELTSLSSSPILSWMDLLRENLESYIGIKDIEIKINQPNFDNNYQVKEGILYIITIFASDQHRIFVIGS